MQGSKGDAMEGIFALLAMGVVLVVLPIAVIVFGSRAIFQNTVKLVFGIVSKDRTAIRNSLAAFAVLACVLLANLAFYGVLSPMPPPPGPPAAPGPEVVMMAGRSWPEAGRIAAGGAKTAVYVMEQSRIEPDGQTMIARPVGWGDDAGRGWQASLITIEPDPGCLDAFRNQARPSVETNEACVHRTHVEWKGTGPETSALLLHHQPPATGKAGFGTWSVYLKEGERLTLIRRCGSDGVDEAIITRMFNPGYHLGLRRDAAIYRQCWDATVQQLAAGQL
jgi:hypothetical protein